MKKYHTYKSSGVDWIGNVPQEWRVSKFKYVSKLYTGNSLNDGQKILFESEDENHIPYISSKDIDLNTQTVNYNNGLRIPKENNLFKVSPKDSFLLCVEGGSSGRKMVYLDREVCFVNKLCSFKSVENTRFQYYFIQSSNFQQKFKLSLSGLIGGVSISTLRDIELVLPSLEEQFQIVQFLDKKTELIDKLVSTKEQKIDLLKHQRISLIKDVITKGLNSNLEMRDSGIEWIGEIPKHWTVLPLKYFGLITLGKMLTPEERDGYILKPYLRSQNIQIDKVDISDIKEMWFSENELQKLRLQKGDLLINEGGDVGRTSIWNEELEECYFQNSVNRVRFNQKTDSIYYFLYQSHLFHNVGYYTSYVNGVSISHLTKEKLESVRFLRPPLEEQIKITEYLNIRTQEIDNLISMEQNKIDLLKEYRQSLISEVITGKIDVRTNLN
jgi:type I restriction enzyme S subunit